MSSVAPLNTVGCTCFALRKLARTVSRLYDQHMATVGLKTTQYSLLKWAAHEALPVAVLAARMAVERTTLTRNLKPLTDAGWIVLLPGEDARQKLVTITEAGRSKVKSARRAWLDAQQQVQETLGMQQVHALHRELDSALVKLTPLFEEQDDGDTE